MKVYLGLEWCLTGDDPKSMNKLLEFLQHMLCLVREIPTENVHQTPSRAKLAYWQSPYADLLHIFPSFIASKCVPMCIINVWKAYAHPPSYKETKENFWKRIIRSAATEKGWRPYEIGWRTHFNLIVVPHTIICLKVR